MSITDELMEWASVEVPYKYGHQLTAIADRIDAEHEEAIQQALIGEGGVPATDENMAEYGWVRMPVDMDGEYIHVGDVMEWPDGETFEVVGIGGNTLFFIKDGLAEWVDARNKRHHIPDTWEQIIEDALDGYHDTDFDKLVARCKALACDAS